MKLETIIKNWKTTLIGLVAIAGVITQTWLPQYADELTKIVTILTGIGLIAAKDGNKTGI